MLKKSKKKCKLILLAAVIMNVSFGVVLQDTGIVHADVGNNHRYGDDSSKSGSGSSSSSSSKSKSNSSSSSKSKSNSSSTKKSSNTTNNSSSTEDEEDEAVGSEVEERSESSSGTGTNSSNFGSSLRTNATTRSSGEVTGSAIGGLLLFVIVIYVLVRVRRSKKGNKPDKPKKSKRVDLVNGPEIRLKEQKIVQSEFSIIEKMMVDDPNFSADAFKQFASECFVTLQAAWTARDWNSIRPFESETLFSMHNRQLQEYIDNGTINVIERVNVKRTKIIDYEVQGDKEVISISLNSVMRDYVIDANTKEVVEGDKTKDYYTTYRLEFIRTLGVKTESGKEISTTNCPNCGAPTAITSSGRCEYCDSVITTGDYSWVLNELTTI